jgi:hypothetical protein
MRNRVHVINSEYKVNSEKGIVICILECSTGVDRTDVWTTVSYNWWKRKLPLVDFYGKFTVKAIARCNGVDKFDEVIGKRIAESRAKAKAYRIAGKFWNICANKIKEVANTCVSLKNACVLASIKEDTHVIELCNV